MATNNEGKGSRLLTVASMKTSPSVHRRRTMGAGRIRGRELPVFTRTLATMLGSGLPMVECLSTLENQTSNPAFRKVVINVRLGVEGGMSLAAAMGQYPDIFDEMYIGALRAGEVVGKMAENLEQLADHLEATAEMRRRVRAAMMYPAFVAFIATAIASAILIWIIPAFEDIYSDLGGVLPRPTQVLILVSRWVRHNAPLVALVVFAVILAIRQWKRTAHGAYVCDAVKLKMPIFGPLAHKLALCRFAETLGQMLKNGIPILQALDIAGRAASNRVIAAAIMDSRSAVERGEPLSNALRRHRVCDPLLVRMLSAGEKTGRADDMLARVATFYRNEVNAILRELTSLVEPLLIVVLGGIIGTIVVCLFLPIFRMHQLVTS